jgi:hypothetical protein
MRVRLAATVAIAIGLGLGIPAPVGAAGNPPSPAAVASAKQLFAQGLKLYNEGSYREALAAFVHANDIAPRASIQRNIAQCHRDLKDFASAYDAYQKLVAQYGSAMTAPDRRAIQRAIDELALLTGTVRVAIPDSGGAVTIDGRDAGTTPLPSPIRVNLGTHVVVVAKPGFETVQKEVTLNGGDEAHIDGALAPEVTTGHLVVSAPADAHVEVFVDGSDVGAAPWEGDLKPGTHIVEARGTSSDMRTASPKQVEIALRARVEMALELHALTGRVQVDTHTADATIAIDGSFVGKGVWEGELSAGQHELAIEATGYRTYRRALLVHEGEVFHEDARLDADASAPRYEGIYSGLALFGYATPSGASNFVSTASSPLGAGLAVRVGYSFGWIAVEGMGFGSYDYSSGTISEGNGSDSTNITRTDNYAFHRFGGGGAVGARVASLDPHVRLTASALGGVAAIGNIYTESAAATSGSAQVTSATTTYTAPLLMFDAGVLVGWPNGSKIHIAALCMLQFVGSPVSAPTLPTTSLGANSFTTPASTVASGTQVFLGPVIGFDLGL